MTPLRRALALVGTATILSACSAASGPEATRVSLVPSAPALHAQCVDAARVLGFPVPCPERVPTVHGAAAMCPTTYVPSAGDPIFFCDIGGFDVPANYRGVDDRPLGHLIIEASRAADSPARPCFDGVATGSAVAGPWHVRLFECPGPSLRAEREIRHGEGAHVHHVLAQWWSGGISYVASAHGHTHTNRDLLMTMVRSIRLVSA